MIFTLLNFVTPYMLGRLVMCNYVIANTYLVFLCEKNNCLTYLERKKRKERREKKKEKRRGPEEHISREHFAFLPLFLLLFSFRRN